MWRTRRSRPDSATDFTSPQSVFLGHYGELAVLHYLLSPKVMKCSLPPGYAQIFCATSGRVRWRADRISFASFSDSLFPNFICHRATLHVRYEPPLRPSSHSRLLPSIDLVFTLSLPPVDSLTDGQLLGINFYNLLPKKLIDR